MSMERRSEILTGVKIEQAGDTTVEKNVQEIEGDTA